MFVYFCSFVGVRITFSYFLSKEIVNETFVWLGCFYSIAFKKNNSGRYTEAVSYDRSFFHIKWQMLIWKKCHLIGMIFIFRYPPATFTTYPWQNLRDKHCQWKFIQKKGFLIQMAKVFLYLPLRVPKVVILKWLIHLADSAESAIF